VGAGHARPPGIGHPLKVENPFQVPLPLEGAWRGQKAETPRAVVNTLDPSLSDPQMLHHRDMVVEPHGPNGLSACVLGKVIRGYRAHSLPVPLIAI
jgi:hypothetical protein